MNFTPKSLYSRLPFPRFAVGSFLLLTLFLPLQAIADTFSFPAPTPTPNIIYAVGNSVTLTVAIMNGGVTDTLATDPVTVQLFDTVANTVLDHSAKFYIINGGVTTATYTDMATPNFTSGVLKMIIQLNSGCNSEVVSIFDNSIPAGNFWPSSGGLTVKGSLAQYYPLDQDFANPPQNYTPPSDYTPGGQNFDFLIPPASTTTNGSFLGDQIPDTGANGVTGSLAYAVTAVNAGYAFGSTSVTIVPEVMNANTLNTPTVHWEVIFDYGASTPLTDWDNPRTTKETVFTGSQTTSPSAGLQSLGGGTLSGAYQPYQPLMTNGQIILRVWATGTNSGATPVSLVFSGPSTAQFSFMKVPYSSNNSQPVAASFAGPGASPPVTVVADSTASTLYYVINNKYSSAMTEVTFQVPNSPFTSTYWNVGGISTSWAGSTASCTTQASGSGPGTVTFDTTTLNPLTPGSSVTLTMSVTGPDTTFTGWQFPLLTAVTSSSALAPVDATAIPALQTLGIPPTPTTFNAVPVSFISPGAGHAVSLSWSQVSAQSATGYVISRVPGGAGLPTTVSPNTQLFYIDSNATNQTSYTYKIAVQNAVAQSPTTSSSPVTPYVNPGDPTSVQALTGKTTVQLNWATPVAVAGSFPVTGFQIWRNTSPTLSGATSITTVNSSTLTYNDTGLSPGIYFYYLLSDDNQYGGTSSPGPHVSSGSAAVTGNPTGWPPTGFAANLSSPPPSPVIGLTWTAPDPTLMLNGPAANYLIYRVQSPGVPVFYASVGSAATTYADSSGLVQGKSYIYQVAAVDGAGVTSNLSTLVTQSVGPSPPGTPTPTAYGTAVTLVWPSNAATENVQSYLIYRSALPAGTPVLVGTPVPAPTSGPVTGADSTLTQGINYTYQIAAVDGTPVTSLLSAAATSALLPLTETGLSVTVTGASLNNVNVTWAALLPGNANAVSYILSRNTVNNPGTASQISVQAVTVAGNPVTSYLDGTALSAGTTQFYFLQAKNVGGLGPVTMQALQIPPNAPTTPAFSAAASAVILTWTANAAAEAVTYYTVYRDDGGGGGFVSVGLSNATSPAVTFIDGTSNGVTQGGAYTYKITATNPGSGLTIVGGESKFSGTKVAGLLPAAETGLAVSVTGAQLNNVNAIWDTLIPANSNAVSYLLFRNTANNFGGASVIATLPVTTAGNPVTSYLDNNGGPGLSAGVTYFYFLRAKNPYGVGPVISQGLEMPPNAPATAASTSTTVTNNVNWVAVNGQGVTNYTVYRVALPAVTPVAIATVTYPTITYPDSTGLAQGVTYVYFITATNPGGGVGVPGGESLMSAGITMGLAPPAPGGLNVTGIDTSNNISLAWTDVTGAVPNATSVSLLVNTTNSPFGAGVSAINITPPTTTSYVDQGVYLNQITGEAPDTTFYYFIETNDFFGSSAPSAFASKLTYPAPVVLNSVTLAPDGVSRVLTYNIVGGPDVTQYRFYRELQGGSAFVSVGAAAPLAGPTMSVTLTNSVLPGQVYLYKVTAVNATGEGSSATTVSFGTAPSAPVSLTAVSGVSAAGVTVDLGWADSNYATENVSGYTVYRSTVKAGPYNIVSPVNGVAVPVTLYSDGAVSPPVGATVYYYLVGADDTHGNESVANTTNAVAVTAYALPAAPTAPAAAAGQASVTLSWSGASATTYPVSGYNIYRSTTSGTLGATINATPVPASPFTDSSGIVDGTTYYYTFQTVDTAGYSSALTSQVNAQPVAPPGVPGNVAKANGNQAVQVSWVASVPGSLPIGFYIIQRVDLSGPTTSYIQVAGNLTGYVDNIGSNTGSFAYSVAAVDNNSGGVTVSPHVSAFSAPVTGVPGAVNVNPPGNVVAQGGVAQDTLTWASPVPAGGGVVVTGYTVYRNQNSGLYAPVTSVSVGTLSFNDTPLANGVTYGYYLVSNATGTINTPSAGSATIFVVPAPVPAPPSPVSTGDGNHAVSLSWAPVAANGVPISNYVVYRALLPGAPAAATTVYSPAVTFLDSTPPLSNGSTYVYTISAINTNGTVGTLSAPVTGYPYSLGAPTVLQTGDSANAVTLVSWTPPAAPSFAPLTYQVLRGTVSGGEIPLTIASLPVTGAAAPLIDTSAVPGQVYYYEIEAIDTKGHVSAVSNEVVDGAANPINGPATVLISSGNGQVLLDWQAPVSAAGSLPVSEYIVTPINGSAGSAITVVAGQPWDLQLGLSNGAPVSFTVQSVDSTGQTSGNHISAPVTVTTSPSALAYNPPTGLTAASSGPTSIQLAWTRPNDEGLIVTSYNIYRTGSFTTVLGSPIANIANSALAPVTTYTDTTVTGNNTYYYVVTAVYQTGATTTESPASNHASVTTAAPNKAIPPVTMSTMAFDANVFKPLEGQVLGIYYIVPTTGPVEIDVYNVMGYPVKYMDPGVAQSGVQTSTTWDGTDRNGKTVATGIYLIEIKATGFHQVKKVAVVK